MYDPVWEDVVPLSTEVARNYEFRTRFLAIDWQDLLQEAWIVFHKCVTKQDKSGNFYEFENRSHFFAFFKIAFVNKITDMHKYKKIENEAISHFNMENEEGESYIDNITTSNETADFDLKLSEAPQEIRTAITLIQNLSLSRINNVRLCAYMGIDANKRDILQEIREYFKL